MTKNIKTALILVVDNDAKHASIIEKILSQHEGWSIVVTASGEAGYNAWLGGKFDLILMDVVMPGFSGCDATKMIRMTEVLTHRAAIQITAVTAGVTDEARKDCIDAGMDGFISKPFNMQDLISSVAASILLQPRLAV